MDSASWSDWVAVGIAALAAVISVWSAWYTVRRTREMSQAAIEADAAAARAGNYTRIHELLIEPVAASGRRQLFLCAETGVFPGRGDAEWDRINYSLALYDTLGAYVLQGMVDEDMVLKAWHHPLQNIAGPVRAFMQHRANEGIGQPWSFLMDLLRRAEQSACLCPPQAGLDAPPASVAEGVPAIA